MARKQLFRSTLAGQTAALALAVAWGAMVPLAVGRDGKGIWSLHLNVALAERGRGGGDSGGSSGSGGGGDSDGGGSGGRASRGRSSGGSSDRQDGRRPGPGRGARVSRG